MNTPCEGKTVIVTGAGMVDSSQHGIGSAVALALANAGARVFAIDRDEQRAQRTASLSSNITAFACDATNFAETQSMAKACAAQHGGIDGLVNSVGITQPRGLLELSEAQWRTTMDVNVLSMVLCCKAVIPYMLQRGSGSIVNVSSLSGCRAIRPEPAYSASKGAVNALSFAIALEFAARGIRTNAIAPGLIRTPLVVSMTKRQLGDDACDAAAIAAALAKRDAASPTGRMGTPPDVAALAVWLVSDASKYVNAAQIPVDGGLAMRGAL